MTTIKLLGIIALIIVLFITIISVVMQCTSP